MKDGEREVHEFMGMRPLKPDADLVKLTKTLAFREFWESASSLTFSEATTLLGLISGGALVRGHQHAEFGLTLYFVSQLTAASESGSGLTAREGDLRAGVARACSFGDDQRRFLSPEA